MAFDLLNPLLRCFASVALLIAAPAYAQITATEETTPAEVTKSPNALAEAKKYRAECDNGDAAQCVKLADMHRKGMPADTDQAEARKLLTRACELDAAIGCNEAGKMAVQGIGGALDLPYAAMAFDKGCEAQDFKACTNVAVLKQHGRGVEQDAAAARASYISLCADRKVQAACHNLAGMMRRGTGGQTNDIWRFIYRANCNDGYKASCRVLARIEEQEKAQAAEKPGQ